MDHYNLFLATGHQLINSLESSAMASVVLLTLCSTMIEVSGGLLRMCPLIRGVFGCRTERYIRVIMVNWNRYGISLAVSIMMLGVIYEQGIFDIMKVLVTPVFGLLLTAAVVCRLWEMILRKRQDQEPVKISAAEWKIYIQDALPILLLIGFAVCFLWKWSWRNTFLVFSCFCAFYGVIIAVFYLPGKLKTYWTVLELLLGRVAAAGIIWGINAVYMMCEDQLHLSDQAIQILFDFMDPFPISMGLLLLCAAVVLASAVFGMAPVLIVCSLPMTVVAGVLGVAETVAVTAGIISIWLGNMIFVYRKSRGTGAP